VKPIEGYTKVMREYGKPLPSPPHSHTEPPRTQRDNPAYHDIFAILVASCESVYQKVSR